MGWSYSSLFLTVSIQSKTRTTHAGCILNGGFIFLKVKLDVFGWLGFD